MTSLLGHSRALQFAGAATIISAAIMGLPLLAAQQFDDSYYADQIVQTFQKVGAQNTNLYSNRSVQTSAFDLASYFTNTCFRPTEYDMPGCKEKFGPYANLRTTYDTGKLAQILSRVSYLKDVALLLSEDSSSVYSPETSSTNSAEADFATLRKNRAAAVWKLCSKKFTTHEEATSCYQRNIRLITERTEDVSVHLVY